MSVTIDFDLPESVAAEARARGLLDPKRVASLITRELNSERDLRNFFEIVREIRAQPGEPNTMKASRVKTVVDTNTLISGALWQGPCALFIDAAARKSGVGLVPQIAGGVCGGGGAAQVRGARGSKSHHGK
jgi:hypothetical protein